MDKLAMKDQLARGGVALPWYHAVSDAAHLKALSEAHPEPLILKPVDSRGARGVLQLGDAANRIDLDWAFSYAQPFSPTGRVMVEAFLPGPQISTESLVLNGAVHTPGFSDRNYELMAALAPHVVEDGGNLPSFLAEPEQALIREEVARAALAMGVQNGVVKGDMVLSGGRAYVIEIATRLSGGYFCTHSIPLNTGVDFVGCAIRQALGEAVTAQALTPQYQRHVCQRYFFPEPGRVVSVSGAEAVAAREEIPFCEVRVQAGDEIGSIENHPGRPGLVIAIGSTRAEAQAAAERAVADIVIETERSNR
nr:ATP-grasp domain-containing protein [Acanthopleuribacter pedis]